MTFPRRPSPPTVPSVPPPLPLRLRLPSSRRLAYAGYPLLLLLALAVGAAAQSEPERSGRGPKSGGAAATRTGRESARRIPAASPTPNLLAATPRGTPIPLGVDPALEEAVRKGEDLILNREYDVASAFFDEVERTHPDSAVGPLGRMLVHQSRMLENGDFASEPAYEKAGTEAGRRLAKALKRPGEEVWDRLLTGGYYGVRGLHAMRKKSYLRAVDDGWEALSLLKHVKKLEPALADADVGLGCYDYWRSVITRNVSWIPFFPDKRKQGMAAMERGFVEAQYTRPIAQIILVYVYIDERKYEEAIELARDIAARYPRNTLVRVQLARALSRKGRYRDAIEVLREVERLQPDNRLVAYYLGANHLYEGKDLDTAENYLRHFLIDPPGTDWRGWAYERLGDVYIKRKRPETALVYWQKALRDNEDDKGVARKIDRLKRKRRSAGAGAGAVPAPTPGKGPGTLP